MKTAEPSNPALTGEPASMRAQERHARLGASPNGQGGGTNVGSAKRRWPWQRLRPPRRLKFTREGKFFVGITLGVGFAAINTGNNLLYLLLGMLLALIIVSGLMSELSLRDLTVVRRLPLRAQVGRPHLVEIEVFNHKGRVPSYAIEVEDLRAGQPADKRCFFLKISPKSAQVAAYRRTPAKRGRDKHVGFRIATRFPFGLFEKSREVPAEGELIIYPAVDPLQLPALSSGRNAGGETSLGRGHGDDYIGLKLLRDGEDRRDVHWRKSAAVGQLVMRERARDARPDVVLALDVVRRDDAKEDQWSTTFERRIRDVASRAVAHIKRGDSVTIKTTATETVRGDRSTGADRLLRFLALVETTTTSALAARTADNTGAARSGRGELEARSPSRENAEPVRPPTLTAAAAVTKAPEASSADERSSAK
ncbi:MAG: hypothetical protein K0S65_3464 [Labilithrix sp.]|nr:hypothetical protein [Labilithrix sp.]